MTTIATRLFPPEADETELRRQWTLGSGPAESRKVLLRMPGKDPPEPDPDDASKERHTRPAPPPLNDTDLDDLPF